MDNNRRREIRAVRSEEKGSFLIYVGFLLLIFVPMLLMFVNWLKGTRDHNLYTQVHVKSASSAESAQELTRYFFTKHPAGMPSAALMVNWEPGATGSYEVNVDSSTVVRVTVTHEGYP